MHQLKHNDAVEISSKEEWLKIVNLAVLNNIDLPHIYDFDEEVLWCFIYGEEDESPTGYQGLHQESLTNGTVGWQSEEKSITWHTFEEFCLKITGEYIDFRNPPILPKTIYTLPKLFQNLTEKEMLFDIFKKLIHIENKLESLTQEQA
jgi:hypothetical protein